MNGRRGCGVGKMEPSEAGVGARVSLAECDRKFQARKRLKESRDWSGVIWSDWPLNSTSPGSVAGYICNVLYVARRYM